MSVAWVFPGQGSQIVGMGRELYRHFLAAREVFDQADAVLDLSVTRLCFEGPEDVLTATENAQPALLTCSVALLRAIDGFALERPVAVAGHSLGEYSALVASGGMDFSSALRLVRRRGELMADAHEGTMAAVMGLDEHVLERICHEVSEGLRPGTHPGLTVVIANYNAPSQLVISGGALAVKRASALARERGAKRVTPLKVSAAFHSPLMSHVSEGMAAALATTTIADLEIPLIANVNAEPLTRAEDVRRELVAQVAAPVHWIASVRRMVAQGVATFVEIGPGKVLTSLIKRIAPETRVVNLSDVEDVQAFVAASCQ